MKKRICAFLAFFVFNILLTTPTFAKQSWPDFLKEIRKEAIAQGIRPEILDSAMAGIKQPNRTVLHLDKTQPEKRLSFLKYRGTRADAYRIKLGRQELKKHYAILHEIGNRYGVSECFIVSLWGLETSYGRFMGTFPVIHSLTTLAYDNRRAAFFRSQLFLAFHILNEGHVDLKHFKGEWAGASGHPQFLPSSWRDFAVDYDGDGHKDIWRSLPDAFASIANYLHKSGWKRGEPWAIPVSLPSNFDENLMNGKVVKSVQQWEKLGIRLAVANGSHLPNGNLEASIIRPDGGPAMMIFNNFRVIMKWNRSNYYAGTVGYMAEQICQRPL